MRNPGAVGGLVLLAASLARAGANCPPDAARVGPLCVDRYEASLWAVPLTAKSLLRKVQQGKATLADLQAGGAQQLQSYDGTPSQVKFPVLGNWKPLPGSNPPSPGVYALSIAGVQPSLSSWHQAQQACALSGKRLLTEEEWRRAADGTPDVLSGAPADSCNHYFDWPPYPTGSHPKCVSNWGVYDMVGNFGEWIADRTQSWDYAVPNQPVQHPLIMGIAGASSPEPRYVGDEVNDGIGFRCAR